jgi:hypothetical protein
MPVISQKFIYRSDLKSNPEVKYLYGDNTQRRGLGGQAKEMRGEPNAIGIATKVTPTGGINAFFSDAEFDKFSEVIITDFMPAYTHVLKGGIVVVPEDGLGTGLSELPTRAPKLAIYVDYWIEGLKRAGEEDKRMYMEMVKTRGEKGILKLMHQMAVDSLGEVREALGIAA